MTVSCAVDRAELALMGEQLGDVGVLCVLVERYTTMLGRRLDRLQDAAEGNDYEQWHDAALSLRTSSAMVGATALSRLTGDVEQMVDRRATSEPRPWHEIALAYMPTLRRLAAKTRGELGAYLECCGQ